MPPREHFRNRLCGVQFDTAAAILRHFSVRQLLGTLAESVIRLPRSFLDSTSAHTTHLSRSIRCNHRRFCRTESHTIAVFYGLVGMQCSLSLVHIEGGACTRPNLPHLETGLREADLVVPRQMAHVLVPLDFIVMASFN